MSKVPSLSYREIIYALRRDGWVVVRQRGSHIRLQKNVGDKTLKLTVPAHTPGQAFHPRAYPQTGRNRA